jgi:hypothetical protein
VIDLQSVLKTKHKMVVVLFQDGQLHYQEILDKLAPLVLQVRQGRQALLVQQGLPEYLEAIYQVIWIQVDIVLHPT